MSSLTRAAACVRPCFFVLLLWVGLTLPGWAADKVALVIGNASYEVGRLANPVNDATDMAAALRAKEFDVTLATNVNRDGMLEQVEAFRSKIRPGGIALVFFAGHAVEQRGENWLLPVENGAIRTQAHVSIHSVSAQDVLSMIEERGARLNILVLDACRDNPLPAGARSAQRGLAAITTGTSSLVAYATSPNRTAADGEGRNSPYTAALLRGLRDPSLSVTDLFNKVGAEVVQATGGAQVPWNSNTPIWPAIYLTGEAPRRIEAELVRPRPEPQPDPLPEPAPPPTPMAAINASTAPGTVFRDKLSSGGEGPAMVVVPAGEFLRGSPEGESGRQDDEGPPRRVQLRAFALGQTEVTRAEFAAFVAANRGFRTDAERNAAVGGSSAEGCYTYLGGSDFVWKSGTNWRDPGFSQDDSHPVVCVSWNDAQAYVAWLSRETGQRYRLPSEAEQEYAIRAGTPTAWPWGSHGEAGCAQANYADASAKARFANWSTASCTDGHVFTSPAGVKGANAFGLHDVSGNVWEWSADCYASSYALAPTDGRAYEPGSCDLRVLRGGSWSGDPAGLRSANRDWTPPADRVTDIGFRLARTL